MMNDNDITISVIVPVYNAESTLRRCVDSILNQTYKNLELLLVNDGSTDSSGRICDNYAAADERVRVFHKSNGGVSSARNLGLDNARGEWIAFCDADDTTLPGWLANYNVNERNDISLICQGFKSDKGLLTLDDRLLTTHGFDFEGSGGELIEKLTFCGIFGYLWCKLFKSSIIRQGGLRFDESLRCYEDEKFVLEYLLLCDKVASVSAVGYCYSVSDWGGKYLGALGNSRLFREMFLMLDRRPDLPQIRKKYFRYYTECFGYMFQDGNIRAKTELCKDYRRLLLCDRNACPMNIIPKTVFLLDRTAIFSAITFGLFLQAKRFIKWIK